MKRFLALILAALMMALCACGQTSAPQPSSGPVSQSQPEEPSSKDPSQDGSSPEESPGQGSSGSSMTYLCSEGFDYAEEFENGYAFAIRGLDCGYVDKEGNFTVCYQIEQMQWDIWFGFMHLIADDISSGVVANQFSMSEEGLYPFRENLHWGYKNIHTGEVVIQPMYYGPTTFREGRVVVSADQSDFHYFVFDTNGNVVFQPAQAQQGSYHNGLLRIVNDKDELVMVDYDGKEVLNLGAATVTNDSWPFCDFGPLYVSGGGCRNDSCDPEHMYSWLSNGEIFYINSRGERTAVPPEGAVNTSTFRGGIAGYRNAEKQWGLFNTSSEVLTPMIFTEIKEFGQNGDPAVLAAEDYSFVSESGDAYYVINNRGERVGEETYEKMGPYMDGLMAACKDGKWGYIKPGEGVVIDFIYDRAYDFSEGIAYAQKDGESYYIDKKGERVEGATTQYYYPCKEGTFLTFNDGKFNFAVVS